MLYVVHRLSYFCTIVQFRNVHTNILLNCSFPKNNYLVEENITDVQFQDTCSLASGAKCAISATGMCYV